MSSRRPRPLKVVLLAGGLGSRLAEETETRPKPMVEIGGRPILWHIMKHFAHFGHREFFVALGYKGEVIKRYFTESLDLHGSLTIDTRSRRIVRHDRASEDWRLHLIETGLSTMTGGRLRRLGACLEDAPFLMTYGDGVGDVDLRSLLAFHKAHRRLATVTVVRPPTRFGNLEFDGDRVTSFQEKPQAREGWINAGYFVLEPKVLDLIAGDETMWERAPMERLVRDGQLMAFKHEGFWQCMDTYRDKRLLESLWAKPEAPWKIWKD